MANIFHFIQEEASHNKAKHAQIVDAIILMINGGHLHAGDMLPSVNSFMMKTGFARMTVVKAMEKLKNQGVIESKNKVGYFVRSKKVNKTINVMFFLTSFESHHEILYNEITAGLDPNIVIDLYFHHCNPDILKSVIKEKLGLYELYIITGFQHPSVKWALNDIPKHKLLQIIRPPVLQGTSYVCQRFDENLSDALEQIKDLIKKYESFTLIFREGRDFPDGIKNNVASFCKKNDINFFIESNVEQTSVKKGCSFFVITDNDLIEIVKLTEGQGLQIGKDIGIISYNETPMKEIIRNGITVISTDFKLMGREIRNFIDTQKNIQKEIPTQVIIRNSL